MQNFIVFMQASAILTMAILLVAYLFGTLRNSAFKARGPKKPNRTQHSNRRGNATTSRRIRISRALLKESE